MSKETIRLGLMAPLTGLVCMYGQDISRAGEIACQEINEKGGLLGKPLELIIMDDGSLPVTSVPAANRLVNDYDCVAIIGNLLSNSRISVADQVAEPQRVPYLNFSFYEGSISGRYFFHFAALPNQQIDKMIPYMANKFGNKMFFAGSNYEWPIGSIDAAKKALINCGGEVVGEQYLPIGSTEIDQLLEQVSKSGADVFVPYFAGSDQVNLLTRFYELGLKKRMKVVMGHYDEAMVNSLPGEVREGFYSSNTYFMTLETVENQRYLDLLNQLPHVTGVWPEGNGVLTNFGEGTYLCVHAFANAVKKAGSIDREEIVNALENISVVGPQGKVVMDPKTHHATVNTHLACCNFNGTFSIIKSFGQIAPIIPNRYINHASSSQSRDAQAKEYLTAEAGVVDVNLDNFIINVNEQLLNMWGYSNASQIIGLHISKLLGPETDFDKIESALKEPGFWQGEVTSNANAIRHHTFKISLHKSIGIGKDSNVMTYSLSYIDEDEISVPKINASHDLSSVVDVAIITTDQNGNIVRSNRCANDLFGYTETEILGMSVHNLLPPQFRHLHHEYFKQFIKSSKNDILMGSRGEVSGYKKDGSPFPLRASISKVYDNKKLMLVTTLQDITEQKKNEEDLNWKSMHDGLTHLPNRTLMRDRLINALNRAKRDNHRVALLFIDLDNFKLVNDSYGHGVGDLLLVEVANRLVDVVRPGDTVARFGGDEFIILCEQSGNESDMSDFAQRINEKLNFPMVISDIDIITSASIGIAFNHEKDLTADDLLRNADAALYESKEQGRDGWHIYNQAIHDKAINKFELTNKLNCAIKNNEFEVRFQLIVDTDSTKTMGVETLLRWFPGGEEISPTEFIPIAEMSGVILPIGLWVFEQACKAEKAWSELPGRKKDFFVSVNVSTRQLNDRNLAKKFSDILMETGATPENIVLEVTETALMSDMENNIKLLYEIAELGLSIAVDDFGTGYSSLSLIMHMPVCKLKIDRIFIDEIDKNKNKDSLNIVKAVIGMAHALNLSVVAEGVERKEEYDLLKKMKCDTIQGYYFSKPILQSEVAHTIQHGIHKNNL